MLVERAACMPKHLQCQSREGRPLPGDQVCSCWQTQSALCAHLPPGGPTVFKMKGGVAITVRSGNWGRGYSLITVRAVDALTSADGSSMSDFGALSKVFLPQQDWTT